jgi:hypothetical protein
VRVAARPQRRLHRHLRVALPERLQVAADELAAQGGASGRVAERPASGGAPHAAAAA